MLEGAEAVRQAAGLFDDEVDGASVPPLLMRWVSNLARTCSRHIFRVWPRRATSGIGQVGNDSMTLTAIALPSAGLSPRYIERSCW